MSDAKTLFAIWGGGMVVVAVTAIGFGPLIPAPYIGLSIVLLLLGAVSAWSLQAVRGMLLVPSPSIIAASTLLLSVGILSLFNSGISIDGLWGTGFEFGTFSSLVLFAAFSFVGSLLAPRSVRTLFYIYSISVAGVASIWIVISLIGKATAGVPPELPVLLASALGAALFIPRDGRANTITHYLLSAILVACLLLFFESVIAYSTICTLAIVTGLRSVSFHEAWTKFATMAVILIALMFGLKATFAMASTVRPSLYTSAYVVDSAYQQGFVQMLLGTGPSTLPSAWERYRPIELNRTSYWNMPVDHLYSGTVDIALIFGALGLCTFLLFPALIVSRLPVMRHWAGKESDTDMTSSVVVLSLLLFVGSLVYHADLPLLLVAALGTGIAAGPGSERTILSARVRRPVVAAALALGVVFFVAAILQTVATYERGRADTFIKTDLGRAENYTYAARAWPIPAYERDAANAHLEHVQAGVASRSSMTNDERDQFQKSVETAKALMDSAAISDRRSAEGDLSRAVFYVSLNAMGFPGSLDIASGSLLAAANLAPSRPDIPYLQAAVARQLGDTEHALQFVKHSLALKHDFEPAMELLRELGSP